MKGLIDLQNKNIVVTGGAGFLGSHVVRLLLEAGNKVTILDNFSHGKELHLKGIANDANLKIIKGDITHLNEVTSAFENCQIVIHLAVLDLRQSIKEPEKVNDVVVNGTLNCLNVARKITLSYLLIVLRRRYLEQLNTFQWTKNILYYPKHPMQPLKLLRICIHSALVERTDYPGLL